jgi:hypothetical protein
MAGIFTSTEVMEQRYMLNEQRVMERLAGLGPEGEDLDARYEEYWRELPARRKAAEQAKSALEALKAGDTGALETLAGSHPEAVADAARDPASPASARTAAQEALVAGLEAALANPPAIPPRAMVPADAAEPADEAVRVAGQFDRPAEVVPRGFLGALAAGGEPPPAIPAGSSGRVELARWLTDVEAGAGRLTARVAANRVWYHLIGQGLVRTPDNFGLSGEPPSHPELLEYLARRLVDSGWSLKALVREIALSRTFALASTPGGRGAQLDPDNRLLWRAHRRRLEPEALRDAMLAAAGQLDLRPVESTVAYLGDQATAVGKNEVRRRTDFNCRSVYLPVVRNDLPELFEAFDFADPHTATSARPKTSSASQALFLLNNATVLGASEAAARRLLGDGGCGGDRERADRFYELATGAPPDGPERSGLLAFVAESRDRLAREGRQDAELRAWSLACQAVMSSSRFQFLD